MPQPDHSLPRTFKPFGLSEEELACEKGQSDVLKKISVERIRADAAATQYLAEMECPADLIEWGRSHGIPNFAEFTWSAGFVHGWRMAVARGLRSQA